ncbi:hypothetical protein PanWU01x14_321720 [Parasponia andersonii]|uniref:Transmembrane protein n=1 Tax=Parasponia andersonii TaxID=3476 RepID=A0A2P5AL28_PARAD|nr:hypothetical protein PanWU01x14_321720 [Parasponia andersonii]
MIPNSDLLLLAFLHGTFVVAVLLLAISVAFIALLLAFTLGLFSIAAVDLLDFSPIILSRFESAKADLQLGSVLVLCALLDRLVSIAFVLKPYFQRLVSQFKSNVLRLRDYIDALKLT